ncbi:hypothetical protein [Desulfosporosinus sp.]|uniref:hypothetical protein n=1 Tax=Desulfosporosinus sp. TaxID=157907 RepID=UPI0025B9C434|nr:hypothetical protein [Desulfosporosinus sp.]MBC2726909.1 hypothetical protein [Desulfosporosinus sp.]
MKLKINWSKLKSFEFRSQLLKAFKKRPNFFKKVKLNRPKSSSLSLSKRDFILLALLVLGFEGYGIYHYLLDPKYQEYSSLKTRYAGEQLIASNFEKDMAQKDQYMENLKLLDYKFSTLTKVIPNEIPQEEIVLILNKLAKDRELEISGISLSTISAVSKQDFAAGKTSSGQTQNTGKLVAPTSVPNDIESKLGTSTTSTANSSVTSQAKPKSPGMVLVEDVDIAFSGSYGALYNFLSDLEKSDRKIIVKELSMVRGSADLLKGQIKLQYVGYVIPEEKSTYSLDTPPVSGKTSPFEAYQEYEDKVIVSTGSSPSLGSSQTTAPVKTYNPDFYLLLSTYDDNAPKIIMGDYTKNGTELYSNTNASVRGKLTISGNQDNMSYSYSLGGATQTKNAKLLMDGGKLRLEVISHARKNEQDKVSLTLDVENKTDYPLEISIISDDQQVPRFSLGTQLGSVTVK